MGLGQLLALSWLCRTRVKAAAWGRELAAPPSAFPAASPGCSDPVPFQSHLEQEATAVPGQAQSNTSPACDANDLMDNQHTR